MSDEAVAAVTGAIRGLTAREVVVVALDGFSGSGKSTLAYRLAEQVSGAVLEGDDFYRVMDEERRYGLSAAEGTDLYFDWERLRDEALAPLRAGLAAVYSPYDWASGGALSPQTVSVGPAPIILVDGVYSSRPELIGFIDLADFVNTTQHVRDERIASRIHGNERWHTRWAAAEKHYFEHVRPRASFDLVVFGE